MFMLDDHPNYDTYRVLMHEYKLTYILCRVLMLGATGVGKSALCSQFLSSEHINTYATVGKLL